MRLNSDKQSSLFQKFVKLTEIFLLDRLKARKSVVCIDGTLVDKSFYKMIVFCHFLKIQLMLSFFKRFLHQKISQFRLQLEGFKTISTFGLCYEQLYGCSLQ
jgi:hypothetical protein